MGIELAIILIFITLGLSLILFTLIMFKRINLI